MALRDRRLRGKLRDAVCSVAWVGGPARLARESHAEAERRGGAAASRRPVYPYSVIAGGAYTRDELAAAVSRDRVVAAHYRGVRTGRLQPLLLETDRRAYVSYRINDAVFWTRQTVRLPRGEQVLSDGENLVRARCGNRISEVPQLPTMPDEPSETDMEAGGPAPPVLSAEPLDPGRRLAILDLEPSPLPHGLALSLPPMPAFGTLTFAGVEPMGFIGHGGALAGPPGIPQGGGAPTPPETGFPPSRPPVYPPVEPLPSFRASTGFPYRPSGAGTLSPPKAAAVEAPGRPRVSYQLPPLPPLSAGGSGSSGFLVTRETPTVPDFPATPGTPGGFPGSDPPEVIEGGGGGGGGDDLPPGVKDNPAPVPEPGSLAPAAMGLLALLTALARRRR